jgi:hypothetical protein
MKIFECIGAGCNSLTALLFKKDGFFLLLAVFLKLPNIEEG